MLHPCVCLLMYRKWSNELGMLYLRGSESPDILPDYEVNRGEVLISFRKKGVLDVS